MLLIDFCCDTGVIHNSSKAIVGKIFLQKRDKYISYFIEKYNTTNGEII